MIWQESVAEAIRRLVARTGNPVFTRHQLIDSELPQIVKEVGSAGKTPEQTLSRILQEFRDQGTIGFEGDGVYRLLQPETTVPPQHQNPPSVRETAMETTVQQQREAWEQIKPSVSEAAEFNEIVHDFGNPLELLREAISNAIDWHATWIRIIFNVEEIEGNKRLVIKITDNGDGMTKDVLKKDFWGLGYSRARDSKVVQGDPKIGEKGHGTKIYLRSEKVIVRTQHKEGAFCAVCDRPLAALAQRKLHEPRIAGIAPFLSHTGTEITIIGYNADQRSKFVQKVIKDYLLWFTKIGSVEQMFGAKTHENFKVFLKALDVSDEEEIAFGHVFPSETSDVRKLFDEKKGPSAADWFVKRYVHKGVRLANHPEVTFDAVISVEGDAVKREYNKMIKERLRADAPGYRVADRYGIWLCKDYIPVQRVNDWITGFGTGSNSFVLLHGFVNCQSLKLTANRGDIANTDPTVLEELHTEVSKIVEQVDLDLQKAGLYTLQVWQQEEMTLQQEKAEFTRRVKNLKGRKIAKLDGRLLIEPINEAELFGVFITIYALHPELFEFEPLDYNTNRGIDIIARNKSDNFITEGEHSYVEMKHTLQAKRFNHAYQHLRWIVCWDFDPSIIPGTTEFTGVEDSDSRGLEMAGNADKKIYFLNSKTKPTKIQVIRFKEFLKQRLGLEFQAQN
jgi:hypothetical protein